MITDLAGCQRVWHLYFNRSGPEKEVALPHQGTTQEHYVLLRYDSAQRMADPEDGSTISSELQIGRERALSHAEPSEPLSSSSVLLSWQVLLSISQADWKGQLAKICRALLDCKGKPECEDYPAVPCSSYTEVALLCCRISFALLLQHSPGRCRSPV